ncbi:MAG: CBS domain-containing protein [Patescibacteria group bacterium]
MAANEPNKGSTYLGVAEELMTESIPTVRPSATIAEAESFLLKNTAKLETINYIYVTEENGRLLGVLSVKEVFRAPKTKLVSEIMAKDLITAKPQTPVNRIAMLALNHRLKDIPIVDGDGNLKGVVPYDAILSIFHEEHVGDALRSAGIHHIRGAFGTMVHASVFSLVKKRIPWLLAGLGGSAVAAIIIGSFENLLAEQIILAAFIPAITYLSDAVGTQSETLFIRTAAIERDFRFAAYLLKDILTGVVISFVLAVVMAIITLAIWQTPEVSIILALSIFLSVQLSMFTAVVLPWAFSKFRVDPAVVGGPLDTIVSDVVSIVVYFTFANIIFKWLA